MLRFVVPGAPVAWKRPGKGRWGNSFDPNEAAKAHITHWARRGLGGATFPEGPVRLDVVAVYPRPERRPAWCPKMVWDTGRRIPAVPSSDRSNVLKLVEDALGTDRTVGWKVWRDDNQSATGICEQVYAGLGESPCVEVAIGAIDLFAALGLVAPEPEAQGRPGRIA